MGILRRVGAAVGILVAFEAVRFFWPIAYSPDALARLVPDDAEVFVSISGIRSSLDRLRATRAFQRAAQAPKSGKRLRKIPDWLLDLVGDEFALAVRPVSPGEPPTLILLGWVGRKHRHLDPLARQLQRLPDSEYAIHDRRHGRQRISRVSWDEFPEGTVADYTVIRGVVIFTISRGEGAIEDLIDACRDRNRLSLAGSPAWREAWSQAVQRPGFLGYGFLTPRQLAPSNAYLWICEKNGSLAMEFSLPANQRRRTPGPPDDDDLLYRAYPADAIAVAAGRWDVLADIAAWIRAVLEPWTFLGIPLPRAPDAPSWAGDRSVVCLPRWEHISENIPVKAPQILAGGDLRSRDGAEQAFRGLVQDIAAATGWRIEVRPCDASSPDALCAVSDDRTLRNRLGIRELPAAVFPPGQWRMGTRRATVIGAAQADEALPEQVRRLLSAHDAALWIDTAALAEAARYGLSVYSTIQFFLELVGRDPGPDLPPGEVLPWIDAAGAVEHFTLTAHRKAGNVVLRLDTCLRDIPSAPSG